MLAETYNPLWRQSTGAVAVTCNWAGAQMLNELFEIGFQVVLLLCLPPFVPCLLFSVPFCAALTKHLSLQRQQADASDNGVRSDETDHVSLSRRLRVWIAIWCIAAVILFVVAYVNSAGIRYHQKPLETSLRLGRGALHVGFFCAPTLYMFAAGFLLARHSIGMRSLVLRTHLCGFAVYALTATAVGISLSTHLGFLKFKLPSGYNPGFMIEPAPIILYTSAIGLLFTAFSTAAHRFSRNFPRWRE